jgi:uncharacterized protein YcaQ
MTHLSDEMIQAYCAKTFRFLPGREVTNLNEALEFVVERGFVFLWPIQGVKLPSLWVAVAGLQPVASEHDHPGHVTWGWKDEMLDKRRWYYGKLLRRKATMVSLQVLPYFYALSSRVDEMDDFRIAFEEGKLTHEARAVAEVLLTKGAQNTIQLRRLAHLSSSSSKSRFEKALSDLQRGLWVLPIGVARAGAWRYAHVYELLDRWLPEIAKKARTISTEDARTHLTGIYLDAVGVSNMKDVAKLFNWRVEEASEALDRLAEAQLATPLDDGRWVTVKLIS